MEQINPQHPVPEMTINAARASEPQLPSKASGSNIELFLAYQIEWLHQRQGRQQHSARHLHYRLART